MTISDLRSQISDFRYDPKTSNPLLIPGTRYAKVASSFADEVKAKGENQE
jgi:hypothetical protein